jgi:RNA polymerase sigma-70 factor (ECF subfamily)
MNDFEKLVEPHRGALRLHCYRMLGSAHDGDDMVQETMIRAFRAQGTLKDTAAVKPWLYRIATNVCLDELASRPRRLRRNEGPPNDPEAPPPEPIDDAHWIEPCPGTWLDPGAAYALKESVALAFVSALQILTAPQRAVLLLRDVVGLSAEETAEALAMSVPAANSALHRARVAMEERVGTRPSPRATPVDRELLGRYLRAWESGDLDAIVSLLHEDATISMPPHPMWLDGRESLRRFFGGHLRPALETRAFRARMTEANGQDALAFYRVRDDGKAHLFGIHMVEVRDGKIATIDHFMTKGALAAFDLPRTI